MPRNALGRGLGALIREPEPAAAAAAAAAACRAAAAAGSPSAVGASSQRQPVHDQQQRQRHDWSGSSGEIRHPTEGLFQVDIDLIDPSPYQPRTRFREEALDELARSIRSSGIVQPLVVRRIRHRFQLIAGERRWRAAQRAVDAIASRSRARCARRNGSRDDARRESPARRSESDRAGARIPAPHAKNFISRRNKSRNALEKIALRSPMPSPAESRRSHSGSCSKKAASPQATVAHFSLLLIATRDSTLLAASPEAA